MADESRAPRGRPWIKIIVWVVALAALALFIVLNFEDVTIDLLVEDVETQLGWALLGTSLLGFLAGYFWPHSRR